MNCSVCDCQIPVGTVPEPGDTALYLCACCDIEVTISTLAPEERNARHAELPGAKKSESE